MFIYPYLFSGGGANVPGFLFEVNTTPSHKKVGNNCQPFQAKYNLTYYFAFDDNQLLLKTSWVLLSARPAFSKVTTSNAGFSSKAIVV